MIQAEADQGIKRNFFSRNSACLPSIALAVSWRDTRYGQVRESGLVLHPRAGFRLVLRDTLSLDTSIGYSLVEDDLLLLDFDSPDSSWYPGIGLLLRF